MSYTFIRRMNKELTLENVSEQEEQSEETRKTLGTPHSDVNGTVIKIPLLPSRDLYSDTEMK